jgi:hypothetical protein
MRSPCPVCVASLPNNVLHIYSWIILWGTASTSSIEILERLRCKALRMIVDAPWYVPNMVILRDLQTPTNKEEIRRYSSQYSARLSANPNDLIVNLLDTSQIICLPDS